MKNNLNKLDPAIFHMYEKFTSQEKHQLEKAYNEYLDEFQDHYKYKPTSEDKTGFLEEETLQLYKQKGDIHG